MRVLVLVMALVLAGVSTEAVSALRIFKRSTESLISSGYLGATATFGERGVENCLSLGHPAWKCYTEQSGIEPNYY